MVNCLIWPDFSIFFFSDLKVKQDTTEESLLFFETMASTDDPKNPQSKPGLLSDQSEVSESSLQRITQAIQEDLPLVYLREIIETASQDKGLGECFPLHSQWDQIIAALKANRGDVLELLLKNGISPDITCPEGQRNAGITALQVAAELEKLDLVKILMDHRANVNTGKALYTHKFKYSKLSAMFPPNCENALCIALGKDHPLLMKLLLPGYDPSYHPQGRSPLHLACKARATKCITCLLQDPEIKTVIDPSDVPLRFGYLPGVNVVPILYKEGCRQGAYSSYDLGLCLCYVTRVTHTRSCYCSGKALRKSLRSDLEEMINMLVELGADVNFESAEYKSAPLEGLLKTIYLKDDSSILRHAIFTLLSHGATVKFIVVNDFFLRNCAIMLHSSPEECLDMAKHLLDTMSHIYNVQNADHVIGLPPRPDSTFQEPDDEYMKNMCTVGDIAAPLSPTVEQAIRSIILNVDLTFVDLEYAPCSHIHYPILPECPEGCITFLVQRTSILPHRAYQLVANMVHMVMDDEAVTGRKCETVMEHFPLFRSLKSLSRVTILENLPFPRTISVEKLLLPKIIQNYVCLQ